MLWIALAVALLAVALLVWAVKPRRARQPLPKISPMKATLERRIRDGADFKL